MSSWEDLAQKEHTQAGLSVFKVDSNLMLKGPNTKKITPHTQIELCRTLQAQMGDVIVVAAGRTESEVCIFSSTLLYYTISLACK